MHDTTKLPDEETMQAFIGECNRLIKLAKNPSKPPGARLDAVMHFLDLTGVTDVEFDAEDEAIAPT